MIITLQIILVIIDIVLIKKNKNTIVTKATRTLFYYMQNDITAVALVCVDIGREFLYDQRKDLENGKIITYMMVFSLILLAARLSLAPRHFLLMVCIMGSLHYSYKDNHKSSHSHFAWMIYNFLTRNYVLVIDDILYGIRSILRALKEDIAEIKK